MSRKGQPATGKNTKGTPRPQMWTYKDPLMHEMHHQWQARKAQAKFRDEGWTLTLEQFYNLWKNDWYNKGRTRDNMCMTRIDPEKEWSEANTKLVSRYEHLLQQSIIATGKPKRGCRSKKNV